ncbi:NAD(P)H-dependent oxidoreductase [Streptomyces sp. RFCAC02]|uniref:NADPH-dependent FMN reductase n=1 Tax=Streptomyces sp. RFCAC02 TaxID=2499143 RepID=UPI0010220891|nr:NAD(P)H-dependent oxidoreductase [Streptomyces sp. RFCAC02]
MSPTATPAARQPVTADGSPGRPPLRLAVIIGSVREGRFGPTVARWFADHAGDHGGFEIDLIDLAATPLSLTMDRRGHEELGERLAAAEAFAVVTPEYNHSFPAALKNTIDWYNHEWHAKPVGFLSYGGLSGGLRAVEQLRVVFAELHAVTIRDTVSFHGAWSRFGEDGRPVDDDAGRAAGTLLDQLAWWAHALREARAASPYVS